MRVIKDNCSFNPPIAILQKINSQSNNPNIVLNNNINILGVVQIKSLWFTWRKDALHMPFNRIVMLSI